MTTNADARHVSAERVRSRPAYQYEIDVGTLTLKLSEEEAAELTVDLLKATELWREAIPNES